MVCSLVDRFALKASFLVTTTCCIAAAWQCTSAHTNDVDPAPTSLEGVSVSFLITNSTHYIYVGAVGTITFTSNGYSFGREVGTYTYVKLGPTNASIELVARDELFAGLRRSITLSFLSPWRGAFVSQEGGGGFPQASLSGTFDLGVETPEFAPDTLDAKTISFCVQYSSLPAMIGATSTVTYSSNTYSFGDQIWTYTYTKTGPRTAFVDASVASRPAAGPRMWFVFLFDSLGSGAFGYHVGGAGFPVVYGSGTFTNATSTAARTGVDLLQVAAWPGFDGGRAQHVAVQGSYAYVATIDTGNLLVFDISNPRELRVVGSHNGTGQGWQVQVEGHFAYIAAGPKGLQVIDITDPSKPQLAATCSSGFATCIFVSGGRAFLAGYATVLGQTIRSFCVVDVTDPLNPRFLGSADVPGYASLDFHGTELT